MKFVKMAEKMNISFICNYWRLPVACEYFFFAFFIEIVLQTLKLSSMTMIYIISSEKISNSMWNLWNLWKNFAYFRSYRAYAICGNADGKTHAHFRSYRIWNMSKCRRQNTCENVLILYKLFHMKIIKMPTAKHMWIFFFNFFRFFILTIVKTSTNDLIIHIISDLSDLLTYAKEK